MAINKNSNAYIIIYTVVMVVIVGSLLAFLATSLKPQQDANVLNEQKVSIMKAFGEADANFDDMVKIGLVTEGEFTEVAKDDKAGVQAVFDLLGNRKALSEATAELPIFVLEKDGATKYVLPIVGKGLWGDIWGYVSLQQAEDNVVITGIVMDHAGETPGLGAEIATERVQKMFEGKALYNEANEFAVRMQKGGAQNEHQVDAITGGTKTCDGVNAMLAISVGKYEAFLRGAEATAEADTEECACSEEECSEECCGECADECADECCSEEAIVEPVNVEEE
ncbi:MAG: NADH:ubiquinone reductase (Na(+)-transporting) subunit C [Alistipes sp.]|nr:NADH:ubiquinone reductase (Na(+)-transporting) subunit C [Alistipes sp.]